MTTLYMKKVVKRKQTEKYHVPMSWRRKSNVLYDIYSSIDTFENPCILR